MILSFTLVLNLRRIIYLFVYLPTQRNVFRSAIRVSFATNELHELVCIPRTIVGKLKFERLIRSEHSYKFMPGL